VPAEPAQPPSCQRACSLLFRITKGFLKYSAWQ
jgi:hypothetical protein